MTREDLQRLCQLDVDFESIGLIEPGMEQEPYFCDPVDAQHVGRLGVDGIHFILLPGDERVFCVDPAMGEAGTYVLPVAEDLRQFLSYLLWCGDASPLSQIWWLSEERFRALPEEDAAACTSPEMADYNGRKAKALYTIKHAFDLEPAPPYQAVRALQAGFDHKAVHFSTEYYDVLGIEREQKKELIPCLMC